MKWLQKLKLEPKSQPEEEFRRRRQTDGSRSNEPYCRDAILNSYGSPTNESLPWSCHVSAFQESALPYKPAIASYSSDDVHEIPVTVERRAGQRPKTWASEPNRRFASSELVPQSQTVRTRITRATATSLPAPLPDAPPSPLLRRSAQPPSNLSCDSSCWLRKISDNHAGKVSQALISGYQAFSVPQEAPVPKHHAHSSQFTTSYGDDSLDLQTQLNATRPVSSNPTFPDPVFHHSKDEHIHESISESGDTFDRVSFSVDLDDKCSPLNIYTDPYTDLTPWQTRLIKLNRGAWEDSLECNLMVVNMIDSPGCGIANSSEIVHYEALSYSWGRNAARVGMHVNGIAWPVPMELAKALTHLRLEDRDRYLWCDALCINQSNADEKVAQIRSMLRIFEKAETIIAWLGEPHLWSFQLVEAFKADIPCSRSLTSTKTTHGATCWKTLERLTASLRWHLSSNWFFRTWIRQEVFAAKELTLCLGGYNLSFEIFNKNLDGLLGWCSSPHDPVIRPKTLDVLQQEFQHFGTDRYDAPPPNRQKEFSEHWLTILSKGPLFSVTEERDRIYGSIGILSSAVTKSFARLPDKLELLIRQFPVSYDQHKKLGEVFGDVTKFLISVTRMANVLDHWRIPNLRRIPCEGLASWAVDWRYFDGIVLPSAVTYGYAYKRIGCVNQPIQDYHKDSPLIVKGVRITPGFSTITVLKKDKRRASSGQSVSDNPSLLNAILSEDADGLRSFWVEERVDSYDKYELRLKPSQVPELAEGIKQGQYCIAYADHDFTCASRQAVFLVPRMAQMDDIVVSLYGSTYLHLIRPQPPENWSSNPRYLYLGPVLELVFSASTQNFPQSSSTLQLNNTLENSLQISERIYKMAADDVRIRPEEFHLV